MSSVKIMLFVTVKKAYLVDFIGFMIAKVKNISHLFSMSYMASGNRCYKDELDSLLTLRFQTFKESQIITL